MNDLILKLRENVVRENRPDEYSALWFEDEPYRGRRERSMVLVLRTSGCFWFKSGGCTMCGYYSDTNPTRVKFENLKKQVDRALEKYKNEKIVKIYNSGSFFDPNEISVESAKYLLKKFENAERIIVESRPEFIREKFLSNFIDFKDKLMIAIGLESSNDEILENSINKGFLSKEYVRAAKYLNSIGIPVKTYVLLKPPFLTESKAIEDSVNSSIFASKFSEIVSLNPVNVQKGTLVEYLWHKGYYRSPWLWSVVEVLKKTAFTKKVVSFPTAPGKERGAHNCGKCDDYVIKAIEEFSFLQDEKILQNIKPCSCKDTWGKIMELENLSFITIKP